MSDTLAWVAQAQAALLEDDPPPAVVFVPAPTWQEQHYAEYSRRLLAIYAACEGWSRAAVTPLWPWVEYSSVCFEAADADGWTAALAELERFTGVAGSAGART